MVPLYYNYLNYFFLPYFQMWSSAGVKLHEKNQTWMIFMHVVKMTPSWKWRIILGYIFRCVEMLSYYIYLNGLIFPGWLENSSPNVNC